MLMSSSDTLAEIALDVCFGLGFAIRLEKIRVRTGSVVHNIGALIVTGADLARHRDRSRRLPKIPLFSGEADRRAASSIRSCSAMASRRCWPRTWR